MEEMMKPHYSSSSKLRMHKDSSVISEFKPNKIRIIHLYAPEIIKTDVENFRELVQKLTGKPTVDKGGSRTRSSRKSKGSINNEKEKSKSIEMENEVPKLENGEGNNENDEEIWGSERSNGFYNGLSEFEGFMAELSELPSLPLRDSSTDVFDDIKMSY